MASNTSLLNIPDNAMRKILGDCDFVSILVLRKTCRALRNFIAIINPVRSLQELSIYAQSEDFFIIMMQSADGSKSTICYKKHENGCEIAWNENRVKIMPEKPFELFLRDFKNILNYQCLTFTWFCLTTNVKVSKKMFSGLMGPLRAIGLQMKGGAEKQISEVLPFFCPKTLKTIEVGAEFQLNPMGIYNLGKSEQWRETKGFNCHHSFNNWASIRLFCHFNTMFVSATYVPIDTIIILKEVFLNSTSPSKNFKFTSSLIPSKNDLTHLLGIPFLVIDNYGKEVCNWLFIHPQNYICVLQIVLNYDSIEFKNIRSV